jgi:hypothetical protein
VGFTEISDYDSIIAFPRKSYFQAFIRAPGAETLTERAA